MFHQLSYNINWLGSTALHVAAQFGHLEVLKCLLVNGSAVQEKNNDGKNKVRFQNNSNMLKSLDCLCLKYLFTSIMVHLKYLYFAVFILLRFMIERKWSFR